MKVIVMKLHSDTSFMKQPIFRQLDEKHLASETEVMTWSPKMDLIAVANVQGEVILHRLSWQKVWTLSPPADTVMVLSMAWRPDGKVLAIGYSSGVILLCDTENKDVLHVNKVLGLPIFMQWTLETDSPEEEYNSIFKDDSSTFLPKLPPLNKHFGSVLAGRVGGSGIADPENGEDLKKLVDQKRLNILIVGTDSHAVNLFAFGVFPCLEYSLKSTELSGGAVVRICSVLVSTDFSRLFVIVEMMRQEQDSEKTLQMLSFDLPLLTSRRRELYALSMKYGQLASLLAYVSSTIQSVLESWEDILLEIDTKIVNYAREKRNRMPDETVADDFLELLMFGTPSDELEKFLLHDLTEKGLKKLVHSIELSYSNIQKLVLKHLQNVGQAIVYHLADVLGMARWYDRFGVLGLQQDKVDECLSEAGAFMLKVTEVQQVIDQSMKNLKAFFRWLYVVIMRLSEEQVSGEITKITQQELHFVAQFLKENFSSNLIVDEGEKLVTRQPRKGGYNLERVGQYLRDESLLFPPDLSRNSWVDFLASRPTELKEDPLLYTHPTWRSLVQQHEILKDSIQSAFDIVSKITGRVLFPCQTILLANLQPNEDMPVVRQMCVPSTGTLYTAFFARPPPSKHFVFLMHTSTNEGVYSTKALQVEFTKLGELQQDVMCSAHGILDLQFYNYETMSLLLIERQMESGNRPILIQLPLKPILDQAQDVLDLPEGRALAEVTTVVNGGQDLHSTRFQYLQGVKALRLVVSGPRHVVCILFESKRRVRLFEMDIEEDEEEDEEVSGIPEESIVSQPSISLQQNDSSGSNLDIKMEDGEKGGSS